jgi:tetratricopeptide (TPR) repeat protein
MKAGRTRSQRRADGNGGPPRKEVPQRDERAGASGSRRWWFRALTLLSPVLLLGLAELGLRLAGYGYPTSFFLERDHAGRKLLVENPKFGWRFFPPSLARSPQPLSFPAAKAPDTMRIFVLGESAAMGDPEPAYGFPRQLERILRARDPNHKFEVINTAMTAINSHVIREIARDCAPRQGDFWVIYMGNNEVVGPFGAGTVFGRQTPSLAFVQASLLVKSTRLGQWLQALRSGSRSRAEWLGMEMFLRNQVPCDSPDLRRVYEHFASNLPAIIELGRGSGATVLLSTVAANLRDSPPFASQHHPGLSPKQAEEWDKCLERGRQAQEERQYAAALAAYNEGAQIDAQHAELAFRRATCELALNQTNATGSDFSLARDLDTLRFRADTQINHAIRQVAAGRGVTLIDAEQACARAAAGGIPGEALFYDHVHLTFAGNYLLAALFAAEIEKKLAAGGPAASNTGPVEAEVERQLALTDFDRRRIGEEMRLRLRQPPFATQLNALTRDEQWQRTLDRLQASPSQFIKDYQAAVELAPDDWVLHANFGRLLDAAGDAAAATRQWQAVALLLPYEPDAWYQLGDLAYSARSFVQADGCFREALQRKADCLEALNGLGLSLAAQGRTEASIREYKAALRFNPLFSAARVNLAVALANRGDIPPAIAEYRTVLRMETNNAAARINLAKLLARQGDADQAIGLFQEALALTPNEPVASFDLANALAAKGRPAEAIPRYLDAIQAKPDFAEARFNLAMEYARMGNLADAVAQFAEAVRLQPDSVDARFNYGVALAKQQRYAEAAHQFHEVLQRKPDHAAAKSALDRALQLAKGQRPASP